MRSTARLSFELGRAVLQARSSYRKSKANGRYCVARSRRLVRRFEPSLHADKLRGGVDMWADLIWLRLRLHAD